jgi:hypothetical protein
MAVSDYTALQQAILRKTLQQEAEVQNAAGTDLALYEEQLIERAETSTQAALLISQIVLGKVPVDGAKLTSLTLFAQQQFDYYANVLGVANPALGAYEALGRGFASTPEFAALVAAAGGSNGQFVTNTYVAAFGVTPSAGQIQHFVDQIEYFTGLYTGAGIPAASALLQAQGAVLGQIVGEAALQEGSTLDNLAEGFLGALVDGTAVFNAPIQDSQPPAAPDPGTLPQTKVLTSGLDVIGPTTDFPLEADDTVIGNGQTIQSGDSVDLGAGFDKANLFLEPTSLLQLLSVYKLTLTNIEQVNVTATNSVNALIPLQISADNWTGVQEFWLRDSNLGGTAGVIVDDIQSNMALGFDDYQGDASYQYDNGGLGANATLDVILQDASVVGLETDTQAAGDEIGRLNLTVLGAGNAISLDLDTNGANTDGLAQLFLFGDGNISLDDEELDTLTVLNGSAHSGDWDIDLDSTANLVAIGGDGDNYLDFDSGFNASDSFDGGDGDDTLETDANTAQFATSANISGVEHLVVRGNLTTDRSYTNSAGFQDITLQDGATDSSDSLQLNGFSNIIINSDNETGYLQINNTAATTITFGEDGDIVGFFSALDISGVDNATIVYNGTNVAEIETLIIDTPPPDVFTPGKSTDVLAFSGSGDIDVDVVIGAIGLVDLSAMSGQIEFNDDFGSGTDFLIGAINGGSEIELTGAGAVSELVFLGGNTGNLLVQGFDATAGTGDVLDFGAMGISSLAELSITEIVQGGANDYVITLNANPGLWSITLEDVGDGLLLAVQNRIDFDGVVG